MFAKSAGFHIAMSQECQAVLQHTEGERGKGEEGGGGGTCDACRPLVNLRLKYLQSFSLSTHNLERNFLYCGKSSSMFRHRAESSHARSGS